MWVDGRVNGREPPERPSPEGPRKSGSVVCMLLLLAEGVLAALGAGGGGAGGVKAACEEPVPCMTQRGDERSWSGKC